MTATPNGAEGDCPVRGDGQSPSALPAPAALPTLSALPAPAAHRAP